MCQVKKPSKTTTIVKLVNKEFLNGIIVVISARGL
jgi:hypothetical protein